MSILVDILEVEQSLVYLLEDWFLVHIPVAARVLVTLLAFSFSLKLEKNLLDFYVTLFTL